VQLSGNLDTEDRLGWLRARLAADGSVRTSLSAGHLGVSEMTVRRDLQQLEALGVARRVRGGAVATGPVQFAERHRHRARAKARIAEKVVDLLPDRGAVAFDASSTVLRVASVMTGARDLTVVTNGMETFLALQGKPGVHPILTGGGLDERTGSLVGPVAVRATGDLLLRRFFLSAAAVDPVMGASEAALEEAEVKRSLAAHADEVVLCVDASKLDSRALAVGVDWEQVAVLVTDLAPADRRLAPYRSLAKVV